MLGEVGGKLLEVFCELNLPAQRTEGLRDGAASRHGDQSGGWAAGALDYDLLAPLGELDKPRKLTLCLMHAHPNHGRTIAGT